MNAFTEKNLSSQNIEPEHEPIFMQYVSAVSGRVYNDEVVDHLADMLLIFYCGGGTALGAITGASLGLKFTSNAGDIGHLLGLILLFGFIGSIVGCFTVMALLNFRGLLKWDGVIVRRSIRLKKLP